MSDIDPFEIRSFWISSLGEYGYTGEEQRHLGMAGCLNVVEAIAEHGRDGDSESEALKRAFEAEKYKFCLDGREIALLGVWDALQDAGSGTFRFNGGLKWADGVVAVGTAVINMDVEYELNDDELAKVSQIHAQFCQANNIERLNPESMWEAFDDPTRVQYCVSFPVLGLPLERVLQIQINWLDAMSTFNDRTVGVL